MKFRAKLFLTSSLVICLLWASILWPIQHTIWSSFDRLADANFTGTRQGLDSLQKERVDRMRQAGRMLMQIPELRALIAEQNAELSPDNINSLKERLDNLADVTGAKFVGVLDGRGSLVAQNSGSPWPSLSELREYLVQSPQAMPLLQKLYGEPAKISGHEPGQFGMWTYGGRLYQVVGLPLVFSSQGDQPSQPDGALIMAVPLGNELATSLGESHRCDVSFIAGGQSLASSLSPSILMELLKAYGNNWPTSQSFDLVLTGVHYRSYMEPLIDPCSNQPIGVTLIQSSLTEAETLQHRVSRSLLAIMSAGMVIAAIISYFLSGAVTRPVHELVHGVRRVAEGDLDSTIEVKRRDELGELAVAFNDMVAQLRARRELERLVEESRAASQAKSQFLANMSHELRTPLHGVLGMTNLLLGTSLDDRQRHYAELVKSSTQVLTTLINDILDFSKIEAGKLELEALDLNVHNVTEDVVELMAQKAFAKGVEIAADITPDVPAAVRGDATRLRQILLNLIGNAIKFTEAGEIIVHVTREPSDTGALVIRFAISDTGIGIPHDRLDRLFQSFSQVDASTTRRYGGTGLGLAISKQLAECMGGSIGVESEVGHGSTFWFAIKLEEIASPAQSTTKDLAGLRVVTVISNAAIREIVTRQLTSAGLIPQATDSAVTAHKMITDAAAGHQPFSIMVMDQSASGGESVHGEHSPNVPAVMLINANDSLAPNRKGLPQSHFTVVKPVRRAQLISAVSCALGLNPSVNESGHRKQTEIKPTEGTSKFRVLVAEDNEINQIVAADFLRQTGLQATVVGDGWSAVEAWMEGQYDLVLMDCQMPVMDGFAATRAIRERETKRRIAGEAIRPIPIIALTANASGADRTRCHEAGMNGYCGKPFRPEELLEMVYSFLPDFQSRTAGPKADEIKQTLPSASNITDAPPIDMAALLERCTGNSKLALTILEKFEKQSVTVLAEIEECLNQKNAGRLARVSHTFKGTAGIVAAESLRQEIASLEQLARSEALDCVESSLAGLREEIERCSNYLPQARLCLQGTSLPPTSPSSGTT